MNTKNLASLILISSALASCGVADRIRGNNTNSAQASADGYIYQAASLPANQPPPDYNLSVFVDNRGCYFLKSDPQNPRSAWAPWVNTDGKHRCKAGGNQTTPSTAEPQIAIARSDTAVEPPKVTEVLAAPQTATATAIAPPVVQEIALAPAPVAAGFSNWAQVGAYRVPSNTTKVENLMQTNGFQVRRVPVGAITAIQVRARQSMSNGELLRRLSSLGFSDAILLR